MKLSDLYTEESILGHVINGHLDLLRDAGVRSSSFNSPDCQKVWDAMQVLVMEGIPLTQGRLEEAVGHETMSELRPMSRIADLEDEGPAAARHDAKQLLGYEKVRAKMRAAQDIVGGFPQAWEAGQPEVDEITARMKGGDSSHYCQNVFTLSSQCSSEDVILGDEWLRRGDISMLISQAGSGKSVAVNGAAMMWAAGLPYLGIKPPSPLRVALFVSEDDGTTVGQQREGLIENFTEIAGREFSSEEAALIGSNLFVDFSREHTGEGFVLSRMEPLAKRHEADLVIINPLLGYVGGNIVEEGPKLLRGAVGPALQRINAAALIAHHTVKLGKDGMAEISQLYAGTGGAEMANIPRASLVLNPTADENIFRLRVEKRLTVGWQNEEGRFVREHFIRRTSNPQRPAWLDLPHDETADQLRSDGPGPARKCTGLSVRKVFDESGEVEIEKGELVGRLAARCDVSLRTASDTVRGLIQAKPPQLRVIRQEPRPKGGKPLEILELC